MLSQIQASGQDKDQSCKFHLVLWRMPLCSTAGWFEVCMPVMLRCTAVFCDTWSVLNTKGCVPSYSALLDASQEVTQVWREMARSFPARTEWSLLAKKSWQKAPFTYSPADSQQSIHSRSYEIWFLSLEHSFLGFRSLTKSKYMGNWMKGHFRKPGLFLHIF